MGWSGQDDDLRLAQQALCTICLADQARRLHCTVKLGKDNSPSSLMDHMRVHHQDEYNAVVVANSKGLSLPAFTAQRKEPRGRKLLGNSSVRESPDHSPGTPSATPSAGNGTGAALHEASMARRSAVEALFQDAAAQQPGAPGTQRSMPDMFKASSSWTDKQDNSYLLGCKKPSKMVPPPATAPEQNVVDVVKLAKEDVNSHNTCQLHQFSQLGGQPFSSLPRTSIHITHASYTNSVNLEDNHLAWWKQHGHLFPTLSRLARRYLTTPVTSCPVERLFSDGGQVDSSRMACVSSDNLTLLVFMHEALPLIRKNRVHRIVEETVGVL